MKQVRSHMHVLRRSSMSSNSFWRCFEFRASRRLISAVSRSWSDFTSSLAATTSPRMHRPILAIDFRCEVSTDSIVRISNCAGWRPLTDSKSAVSHDINHQTGGVWSATPLLISFVMVGRPSLNQFSVDTPCSLKAEQFYFRTNLAFKTK